MNVISPWRLEVFGRLLAALEETGRTHEIDDVMQGAKDGRVQIWSGANDSIVVTEILSYPRKRVMRYWLAAGALPDIMALIPELEDWGRAQGASQVEAMGRLGWAREARALGYTLVASVYRKEL